jgi:dihydrofolate reductase
MRTVLYGSVGINGYIGQASAEHPIAPAVLGDFLARVAQAGNVTMGRRTAELMTSQLMTSQGAGSALAGGDVDLVVLSKAGYRLPGVHPASNPEEALEFLAGRGHATALVGGGAATDNAFLGAGLVSELYLNILPRLTGPGPSLSLADGRFAEAELLDTTALTDGIVQLRYRCC